MASIEELASTRFVDRLTGLLLDAEKRVALAEAQRDYFQQELLAEQAKNTPVDDDDDDDDDEPLTLVQPLP